MRAQSISIQLSTRTRCSAGCMFCISRTTPGTPVENPKEVQLCNLDRLDVGLMYAERLGATHAILTGRADPSQEDPDYLELIIRMCKNRGFLVDMHTNGYLFQANLGKQNLLARLVKAGLTMITLSIASHKANANQDLMHIKHSPIYLIKQCRELGLMVRASLIINKSGVKDIPEILEYIRVLGNLGVQMIVLREVWIPKTHGVVNKDVWEWNMANKIDIGPLEDKFSKLGKEEQYGISLGNPLPWGTPVFLIGGIFDEPTHGVNVTFARCEEANVGTVIKSIVHMPDGHGYRNWNHKGDILY